MSLLFIVQSDSVLSKNILVILMSFCLMPILLILIIGATMKRSSSTLLLPHVFNHLKLLHAAIVLIIFIGLVTFSLWPFNPKPVLASILLAAHNFPVRSVQYTPQSSISRWSSRNYCNVTSLKSWENGLVTLLQPRIKANCEALRKGDERELKRVKKQLQTWVSAESDYIFFKSLNNCSHIVDEYSNNFYVSSEEENYPVAYILVVYTNVQQVLRLLKAIYQPHNLYCIHPDAKQEPKFIRAFQAISRCLDNVFVASKLEKVYYRHHSIMDAQLSCMQDLMRFKPSRWRYAINLCGRELPLKTNREIVQNLIKLNGSSAIHSSELPNGDRVDRFLFKANLSDGYIMKTQKKLGPVPYNLKLYKGLNYMVVARSFVSFLLTNATAVAFRKYLKDVKIPEEHFYSTLYHAPGVPGGPPKNATIMPNVETCIWMNSGQARRHPQELCKGSVVHDLCILSSGDLPTVYSKGVNAHRPTFFFNKYFIEWDHIIMDCMEERLVEQNKLEYENDCLIASNTLVHS